jgi:sugar phosphate isomerase/epimerase
LACAPACEVVAAPVRALGLHQFSAVDVPAIDLVVLASKLDCQHVCLYVNVEKTPFPEEVVRDVLRRFPLVNAQNRREVLARVVDTGVKVSNLEFFPITADVVVQDYGPVLDLGGELGGERIVTHVYDADFDRAGSKLAELAELALQRGLSVGIEFMGMSACNSVATAVDLIRRAGSTNVGIGVDFLHLVRTGGSAAQVASIPRELIGYAQICDGADLLVKTDYTDDALNRSIPGEGCFPIAEIVAALPLDVSIDVEVPAFRLQERGVPAFDRLRRAVNAARQFIDC